jgi:Rrf2 family transcriptional regulator, iron-sulfur cluster assembly transcription factor
MKFSASIEYAIHSIVYLGNKPQDKVTLVSEVAGAIEVPETYLRKIFQQLARNGIVRSLRGAHGGFLLAKDPSEISLKDIVEAIDGSLPEYNCLKDRRSCDISNPCPVKDAFDEARLKMAEVLENVSLQDLQRKLAHRGQEAAWMTVTV